MTHIKWHRAIVAGLAANLASFIIGGGGYLLFGWVFRLEPTSIWRWTPDRMWEMSVNWWLYLIVGNTALALLVALGYAVLFDGIPGRGWRKGLAFGLIFWLIAVLPGAFTVHVLTVTNEWTILYFTVQALIEVLTYGVIIAAIYGQSAVAPHITKGSSGYFRSTQQRRRRTG